MSTLGRDRSRDITRASMKLPMQASFTNSGLGFLNSQKRRII